MNASSSRKDDDVQGEEVFLDEGDIDQDFTVDEEDIPDAKEEEGSDTQKVIETAVAGNADDSRDDSTHVFTRRSGKVCTVSCSPTDATLAASGVGNDRVFLWRINRDWAFGLEGDRFSVSSLAFSTDGQLLASGGFDGIIRVWDVSSGHYKCRLRGISLGGIKWIRWHPRAHWILAGYENSTARMWTAERNACFKTFTGHGGSVACGDFTPNGKVICTGSDDATLRTWNPETGECIHVVRGPPYHTEGLTCLTVNCQPGLALTGSKDGSVHAVDILNGRVVRTCSAHSDSIKCAGFQEGGTLSFATGGMDNKLIIWDLRYSSPRFTCHHEDGVTSLLWLPRSRYIATGCVDGKVRLWDSVSGECVKTLSGHSGAIQSIALSANGDFIVSVSLDGTARVFEIAEFSPKLARPFSTGYAPMHSYPLLPTYENIGGRRGKTNEPMPWPDENEHAFIYICYNNVKARELQCSAFVKEDWGNINKQLLGITKVDYGIERLKDKWNHLRIQHRLFSDLIGHTGVTWDPNTGQVNAPEGVWLYFFTINETEYKQFRKEGCKHYAILTEIFDETRATGGLGNDSTKPLKEKVAQTQSNSEASHTDPYSIVACLNILNNMEGLSNEVYMKAIMAFKDSDFRTSFVMMPEFRRGPVLELL